MGHAKRLETTLIIPVAIAHIVHCAFGQVDIISLTLVLHISELLFKIRDPIDRDMGDFSL